MARPPVTTLAMPADHITSWADESENPGARGYGALVGAQLALRPAGGADQSEKRGF